MNRRSFLGALAAVIAAPLVKGQEEERSIFYMSEGTWTFTEPVMLAHVPPGARYHGVPPHWRDSVRPLTLQEWHDRIDPNGTPAQLARMLNTRNEVLDSLAWKEV